VISVADAAEYDSFRWFVDGEALRGKTGSSITLEADDYDAGTYRLTVIAEKNDVPYSRETSFTVVD
jgi:membrane carboxypeptidase/penicillin-binding protein PbpC